MLDTQPARDGQIRQAAPRQIAKIRPPSDNAFRLCFGGDTGIRSSIQMKFASAMSSQLNLELELPEEIPYHPDLRDGEEHARWRDTCCAVKTHEMPR